MEKRNKIMNDFETAVQGLRNLKVQQLLECALRIEFPGIEICDAAEDENGMITFKIKEDDRYSPEQVENFLNELHNQVAIKN